MPLTYTFSAPGNYTIGDDGVPGNNRSVIRDGSGNIIYTFDHPADSLTFLTSTPGVHLTLNFIDSLGSADFTIGAVGDPAQSPDSVIVRQVRAANGDVVISSNGVIAEGGSDAGADIVANTLILNAEAGIGSAANALETQTSFLNAFTFSGGINLGNLGGTQVAGLQTSGDIVFTNSGNIAFSGPVVGGADVTVTANGATANIIFYSGANGIRSNGGSVRLNAGGDIDLGATIGTQEFSVGATEDVIINAGRDFLVGGLGNVDTGPFGPGGDVIVTAGRNINVEGFVRAGGDAILTAGAGAMLTLPPGDTALYANAGNIILNTDRLDMDAAILAENGTVTIRPVTAGWEVNLGSAADTYLELSELELDLIVSPTLTVGSDSAGPLHVFSEVSPAFFSNLELRTGGNLAILANIAVPGALTLRAGDNLWQSVSALVTADTLAAFVDTVGDDGNEGGIANLFGPAVAGTITITGSADADILYSNFGNDTLNGGGGIDTASYANAEGVTVTIMAGPQQTFGWGIDTLISIENLTGSAYADTLTGDGGGNRLDGGAGNDVLNGAAGADVTLGGTGDDWHYVDNVLDLVREAAGQGNDRVFAGASYALAAGMSVETLTTTMSTGATALNLTGNDIANSIVGNDGANTLNGGGGADTLFGRLGNDLYHVDNAADRIVETAGQGVDRIFTSTSYTLDAGASVETFTTNNNAATTALNLTGNELVNTIYGNAGANILDGRAGSDILVGLAGADSFAFSTALGATNVDRIVDFAGIDDTIRLDDAVFTQIGAVGALDADAFHTGAAAQDAEDRIVYNNATGQLFYDADGSGAGAAVLFATLDGAPALAASDFMVI